MHVRSLVPASLLGLESELGAESLFFLLLIAGAFLDHTRSFDLLATITIRNG